MAVDRTHHQLLPEWSSAKGLVANISSFPVLMRSLMGAAASVGLAALSTTERILDPAKNHLLRKNYVLRRCTDFHPNDALRNRDDLIGFRVGCDPDIQCSGYGQGYTSRGKTEQKTAKTSKEEVTDRILVCSSRESMMFDILPIGFRAGHCAWSTHL
jgi:hypothetical protein